MAENSKFKDHDKAGLIPYHINNGEVYYLMMVASDPKFGGFRPMISKGSIERGEDVATTAIREACEELGITEDNIGTLIQIFQDTVSLRSVEYHLTVFGAECESRDPARFVAPGDETSAVRWMTYDEFQAEGRNDHKPILESLHEMVRYMLPG